MRRVSLVLSVLVVVATMLAIIASPAIAQSTSHQICAVNPLTEATECDPDPTLLSIFKPELRTNGESGDAPILLFVASNPGDSSFALAPELAQDDPLNNTVQPVPQPPLP